MIYIWYFYLIVHSMPCAAVKLSLASTVLLPQRDLGVYTEIVGKMKTEFTKFRHQVSYEPRHEKTCLQRFQPCPTQTGLYGHKNG